MTLVWTDGELPKNVEGDYFVQTEKAEWNDDYHLAKVRKVGSGGFITIIGNEDARLMPKVKRWVKLQRIIDSILLNEYEDNDE